MKTYLKILFCLLFIESYSQELTIPNFTQYLGDNPAVVSPTYMGIGDNIKIRVNGLTQWVGIKGAPDNQSLSADGRLGQRSGIGLFMYNDKNGNTNQKGFKVSFAHHLILDYYDDKYLSLGISFVQNNFNIDINNFTEGYQLNPIITDNREMTNTNFDVGFLYRQKNWDFTANANNILQKETDGFILKEPNKLRNYNIYTSLVLKSQNNDRIEYEPSMHFQYYESDNRSITDLNIKVRSLGFESYYWAGISYRFLNDQVAKPLNIGPMAGLKKNNFYFAYSYQLTTNAFFAYNTGTHMVTLGLDIFQNISNCPCTQRYTKLDPRYNR
jgi:type IX secretion system PorP/SprF family membrane protein